MNEVLGCNKLKWLLFSIQLESRPFDFLSILSLYLAVSCKYIFSPPTFCFQCIINNVDKSPRWQDRKKKDPGVGIFGKRTLWSCHSHTAWALERLSTLTDNHILLLCSLRHHIHPCRPKAHLREFAQTVLLDLLNGDYLTHHPPLHHYQRSWIRIMITTQELGE